MSTRTITASRPEARREKKTFQLDTDVVRRIEAMASRENRNLSNMVETLLKRAVDEAVPAR